MYRADAAADRSNAMKYTTVLFDLDGTLTKSEEGITRSALYAAEKMGFTGFTKEQFMAFIGPPLFVSFQKICGMTPEQAEQAQVFYRERFSTIGWAENEVYAGIASLLRSLKKNGCRIAITTAKPRRGEAAKSCAEAIVATAAARSIFLNVCMCGKAVLCVRKEFRRRT